jgi:acyl-CoA synthetase (AMP-forming)/AMP-acid ligase II
VNLCTLLDHAARRFPTHGAVYVGTDLRWRYAELRDRALRLGAALRADHGAGARVAIASENRAELVELMFGIWAAGQAAVPLNCKLHPKEMATIIGDCGAAAVFASPALCPGLRRALHDAAIAPIVLTTIGEPAYEGVFKAEPEPITQLPPDTLAWLFYTSGTTGRSKGAMLTHRNLMAMTVAHLADVETFDEGASQIHAAPMSHGSGIYMLPYVSRGARQVIPASMGFDADEFLDLCDAHPACGAFLAPTMVQRLRLAAESAGRRPKHLRSLLYGGGPMYVEELKKSLRVFGPVFVQIYGQGESPMTISWLRREDHALDDDGILGSVGWARTGVDVAVVDADGEPLPDGQPGEIVCRGDVVMAGYWNNPTATAETLRGGWLHTGDIGSIDVRGYLTLRDRSKDVVISGGSNVYPREVEEALLTHPAVLEACVVGQADPEWGEVVVAFVVLVGGKRANDAALDAHCLERIARFKRPKRYLFVESLPKNSYGKVLKRELRERLAP